MGLAQTLLALYWLWLSHCPMRTVILCLLCLLLLKIDVPLSAQNVEDETLAVIVRQHPNTNQPAPDAIFRIWLDGTLQTLVNAEENHTFSGMVQDELLLDGGSLTLSLRELHPKLIPHETSTAAPEDHLAFIRDAMGEDFTPLVMPQRIAAPEELGVTFYAMSSETTTDINIYALEEDRLYPLTDVRSLFPEATAPILSASAEFISMRPCPPSTGCGFLYRARLRDGTGADYNALYWYDFKTGQNHEMPYFGKDPSWSPDGTQLAGARLEEADGMPLYAIWIADLETGEERRIGYGCNPKWSPDGEWLAYDVHDNAQWEGYTDCFGNGEVEAVNLLTAQRVSLSGNLDPFASVIGWSPPIAKQP